MKKQEINLEIHFLRKRLKREIHYKGMIHNLY